MHLLHVCVFTCMRLLYVCVYVYMQNPCTMYRDQCSISTTGLQCVYFSQQQSSTDLHAVTCNLGKLNAGAKIHYRAHFTLSTGTADYLATCTCVVTYLQSAVLFHMLLYVFITLFCTHATLVYSCMNEQGWGIYTS